jgi:mannitol-1-/sugar-/sorbitol-6-phosphatase
VISLRCDALLFDLDGVLVDSRACVERILREWSRANALAPDRVIRVAHGRRTIETVRIVAPHLDAEREASTLTEIESTATEGVQPIPGARELLNSLPRSRWAVVTSGGRDVATLRLAHTGLPQPSTLICAEDVRRGKPDPEGYLSAAARLGFEPDACVVVEDAPAGLEAARHAGIRAVGVATTFDVALLAGATYVVRSLAALQISRVGESLAIEIDDDQQLRS